MAYLSPEALAAMGFRSVGRDVRVSDRAAIHDADRIVLGDHCRIDDFCVVSGRVELGRNVHIAAHCLVAGGMPGIVFEDFSGLAYQVTVFAQSDDYSGGSLTNPTVPRQFKREAMAPVVLGRHSIVGAGATIGPGVTLGEGTAIGAHALVLRSTEPWRIHAGTPARPIGTRARDLLALEAAYLASEAARDG